MLKHHFVTIKDIAKNLNISVATVSRALRNTYDVNKETRDKVLAAAAQMNYKPNYNAMGLVNGRSHNIGIIIPFITNYYFSTVITGIQEVAFSKGYNIILFVTNDSPERELSIIQNLSVSNLDGLLVTTSSDSDCCDHFQKVINQHIPVVFFDRVPNKIKTSKVMQDDFYGSLAAVEHLVERGYRRIAHIAGPKGLVFTEKRLQGYLAGLQKHGLPIREEWIIHSGFSRECGVEDTLRLLDLDQRPDAIFAVNDGKAIGAMLVLKENNIPIGRGIGVIGFTNDPMSAIISPSLTTVAEPALEIGKKSCELLVKHITKKNFISEEVIIPCRLIVRESTAKSVEL
jgi:LacI family transcriptional regulator